MREDCAAKKINLVVYFLFVCNFKIGMLEMQQRKILAKVELGSMLHTVLKYITVYFSKSPTKNDICLSNKG
jgi:hypothetical protein